MILERCRAEHLRTMDLQPAQAFMRAHLTPAVVAELTRGCAYTLIDTQPVLCFGFHPWDDDRGCVWAYFAADARRHMVALHRHAERFLTTLSGQIYATVALGFEAGARWVELLGFRWVGFAPEYGRARLPHDIYLQVRE